MMGEEIYLESKTSQFYHVFLIPIRMVYTFMYAINKWNYRLNELKSKKWI